MIPLILGIQSGQIHRNRREKSVFSGTEGEGIDRVSVGEDEKALKMDGCDGCTAMWMYLIPLNCTLKNGYIGQSYIVYILPLF